MWMVGKRLVLPKSRHNDESRGDITAVLAGANLHFSLQGITVYANGRTWKTQGSSVIPVVATGRLVFGISWAHNHWASVWGKVIYFPCQLRFKQNCRIVWLWLWPSSDGGDKDRFSCWRLFAILRHGCRGGHVCKGNRSTTSKWRFPTWKMDF